MFLGANRRWVSLNFSSAFHLRLLMTYLRMETNHEPIAFYPYLSRKQFNNTKDKLEFIQDMVPICEP